LTDWESITAAAGGVQEAGQVGQAGVFRGADAVLAAGPAAVAEFDVGGPFAGRRDDLLAADQTWTERQAGGAL
jgi:hypothetical protein